MNDVDDRERLFVARCSLVLFIAGLLVPFIIAGVVLALSGAKLSHAGGDAATLARKAENAATFLALGFGLIAEILALICGIVGRGHLSGKIGMIGAIIPLMLALIGVALLVIPRGGMTFG